MKNEKHNCKKLILYLLLFTFIIGAGSLISYIVINHDIIIYTVSGQIIDDKDTSYIESMDRYKNFYMIKHEENGEYYLSFKFDTNSLPQFKFSKKDYDKIVSGHIYYISYKCTGEDYKSAQFIKLYDYNPNGR